MEGVRKTVLLVEDDREFSESVAYALGESGYRVDCVHDGEVALEYLQSNPAPCLILLDLMMPGMNGWQFRQRQAEDEAISRIPVVIVSADSRAHEHARALGASGCLRKPIRLDDLIESVERVC